jgi:hypothetical protein
VLYLLWSPSGSRESPHVYRTTALLRTGEPGAEPNWDKLVSDVSAASTELELAEDGKSFLALDSRGSLLRWPVADLQWQDAAPVERPTPTPAITPEQPTCDQEPVRLAWVWERYRQRLGCPKEPGREVFLAVQRFDEGSMVWESDRLAIYVVATGASWQVHDDTFVEGVDMAYDPNLPPPPRQPVRGFGKVWREQLGGPLSDLGWAVEAEGGFDGWRQRFDQGLLLWASLNTGFEGTAYLLFDDGTWEMVPSSMP